MRALAEFGAPLTNDPLAYAAVAGIVMFAAGVATWIPIRRAMIVDPATTLRSE